MARRTSIDWGQILLFAFIAWLAYYYRGNIPPINELFMMLGATPGPKRSLFDDEGGTRDRDRLVSDMSDEDIRDEWRRRRTSASASQPTSDDSHDWLSALRAGANALTQGAINALEQVRRPSPYPIRQSDSFIGPPEAPAGTGG